MSKICKGCGIELQSIDSSKLGYCQKPEQDICQRCYRLSHYGDTSLIHKSDTEHIDLKKTISELEGLCLLVVDALDIEGSLSQALFDVCQDKPVAIVCTKKDILPSTVSVEKLERAIALRLRSLKQKVLWLHIILHTSDDYQALLDQCREVDHNIIFVGYVNRGKSTLINALCQQSSGLTVSVYPHTSINLNQVTYEDLTFYDTPGIVDELSFLDLISIKEYKQYALSKKIKPNTYQCDSPQSFFILPFLVIEIYASEPYSITTYLSNTCPLHRVSVSREEHYYLSHLSDYPMDIQSYDIENDKLDLVIKHIGWFSIKGKIDQIVVKSRLKDQTHLRKAML